MTLLHVFDEDGTRTLLRTTDPEVITRELAERGIALRRRPLRPLPDDADPAGVLEAYREDVAEIRAAGGYRRVDVVTLRPGPDDPDWARTARAGRETFRHEHTHAEDEVRFFEAEDGWVGSFTGSAAASRVPDLDALLAPA